MGRPHGKYKHNSFQQRVGDAGYEAIRRVRNGGYILFRRELYQSDSLIPYIGQDVFLWDSFFEIMVCEGGWDGANKPIVWGNVICEHLKALPPKKE